MSDSEDEISSVSSRATDKNEAQEKKRKNSKKKFLLYSFIDYGTVSIDIQPVPETPLLDEVTIGPTSWKLILDRQEKLDESQNSELDECVRRKPRLKHLKRYKMSKQDAKAPPNTKGPHYTLELICNPDTPDKAPFIGDWSSVAQVVCFMSFRIAQTSHRRRNRQLNDSKTKEHLEDDKKFIPINPRQKMLRNVKFFDQGKPGYFVRRFSINAFLSVSRKIKIFIRLLRHDRRPSFPQPPPGTFPENTVKFLVENKEFSINSSLISHHSDIFHEMVTNSQNQVLKLDSVRALIFKEIMNILFSPFPKIKGFLLTELLEVACRFQIYRVLELCSRFLIRVKSNKFSLVRRVQIASEHGLDITLVHLLSEIVSTNQVKKVIDECPNISEDYLAVLRRYLGENTHQKIQGQTIEMPRKNRNRKRKMASLFGSISDNLQQLSC